MENITLLKHFLQLSEALAADAASSLERLRSPIDQDERNRSLTLSPERTPPLTVKRRRLHSPSRSRSVSPLSSRSPTPSVCSQSPPPVTPRQPGLPVAHDKQTLPVLPETSRARRYELRLSSVSEKEPTIGRINQAAHNPDDIKQRKIETRATKTIQIASGLSLSNPTSVAKNIRASGLIKAPPARPRKMVKSPSLLSTPLNRTPSVVTKTRTRQMTESTLILWPVRRP